MFSRRFPAAVSVVSAPSGEPFFASGSDVTLLSEPFEGYADLTALTTYDFALARYTYNGLSNFEFPSPGGAHAGTKAWRLNIPVSTTYADSGGVLGAENGSMPGADATVPSFAVVEWWMKTIPGYPWQRRNASDQDGAGEKSIIWNSSAPSTGRFVVEPGDKPAGTYYGGAYDAGFPSPGPGVVMAIDGPNITPFPVGAGAFWYFQNLGASARAPNGYMNDGNWHLWKVKMTPSTVQTADNGNGSLEMWVDGVKVLEYLGNNPARPEYNLVLVPTTLAGIFFNIAYGGPFNGGPSPAQGAQWKDYDDIRVWYRP